MKNKGFTLVEILVVVAIVGLLSSVFVIGLGGVRARGRDARRVADVKQVQNAIELYYAKCGHYPGGATGGACNTTNPTGWSDLSTILTTGAQLGIAKIPTDPIPPATYYYAVNATRQGYIIAAVLENDKDPGLQSSSVSSDTGFTWSGPNPLCANATTYCVQF
jgi:prepilin-type N-terminal cleavage/methylation domain-containing protein